MTISVPRLQKIQASNTLPANDRIKMQAPQLASTIESRTNALEGITKQGIEISNAIEDSTINQLSQKAEQDFKPLIHFVVLGLMAGVRPTEISRLSWSDIKIYDQPFVVEKGYLIYGTIEIRTKASKTGRHRQVWINEAAAEFLKKYKDYPIYEKVNFRKEWDKLRVSAGWNVNPVDGDERNWQPDLLRHTWTSFNVALTQDWELTASQAGNSVEVLRTYYVSTTDPREVNKYFGIRPLE